MARLAALLAGATAGPAYPPASGDLREVSTFGVELPIRASIAILAASALVLLDYTGSAMPFGFAALAGSDAALARAVERFVLFGIVPLAIVVLGFRDAPSRYGLRLGDWRWGAALLGAGLLVITPIILGLARVPAFASYYGTPSGTVAAVAARNVIDLVPAEFLLRGFLLFTLLRRIGPLALVVVQVPFVFAHIGKPEIELWSTFIGGSVFAWLDWRTGSILWSALGHVYILTLMLVAVGATG
jgi:membrane protease YdiL (CAAX protease family)